MARSPGDKKHLTPKDVAMLLQVEPGTVRVWSQEGRLRSTMTPGGHRRFSYRDVEEFAREHNIVRINGSTGGLFQPLDLPHVRTD